jgi:ParB/RepB/Spo0J family partition protein
MPRGKPGASSNVLKDRDRVPLKEQPLVTSSGGKEVPVDKVTRNPRNLREDDLWDSPEEKAETVASVKEVGLIQALVVATRAAFLERYPQHEPDIGSARYVVLAGHRRFDAVLAVGLETVRVDVQDGLVGKLNLVMLEENLKRKGLDPFQEGEGYRRANAEDGLSYQDIATATGRSKSHITKRVRLLDLRQESRELVRSRRVSIDSAYNLLTALGEGNEKLFVEASEVMAEQRLSAKDSANHVLAAVSGRNRSAAGEPSGPRDTVSNDTRAATAVLTETKESSDAESTGSSAPIPGARNEPVLTETDSPPGKPHAPGKTPTPASADDAERAEANARRNKCCGRLVADYKFGQVDAAMTRIAAAVLSTVSQNALSRAHSWMQAAGAVNASGVGPVSYRDSVLLKADGHLTAHLAYAVALAQDELRASDRRRRWDHRDIAHLRHLIEAASYDPTGWEKRQLA